MKVKALAMIYYGDMRRREGEVFELKPFKRKLKGKDILVSAEDQFTPDVMERVSDRAAVKRQPKVVVRPDHYPPQQESVARSAHEPRAESEESAEETVI